MSNENYQGLVGLYAWNENRDGERPERIGRIVGWVDGELVILCADGTNVAREIGAVRCLSDAQVLMRATPGEKVTIERPRPAPTRMPMPGEGRE